MAQIDRLKAIETLKRAHLDGLYLKLPPRLDGDTYDNANDIIESIGGIWSRDLQCHVFKRDPLAALQAIFAGEPPTTGDKTMGIRLLSQAEANEHAEHINTELLRQAAAYLRAQGWERADFDRFIRDMLEE